MIRFALASDIATSPLTVWASSRSFAGALRTPAAAPNKSGNNTAAPNPRRVGTAVFANPTAKSPPVSARDISSIPTVARSDFMASSKRLARVSMPSTPAWAMLVMTSKKSSEFMANSSRTSSSQTPRNAPVRNAWGMSAMSRTHSGAPCIRTTMRAVSPSVPTLVSPTTSTRGFKAFLMSDTQPDSAGSDTSKS